MIIVFLLGVAVWKIHRVMSTRSTSILNHLSEIPTASSTIPMTGGDQTPLHVILDLLTASNKHPDGISSNQNVPEPDHSSASALAKHFDPSPQRQHDQLPLQLLVSLLTTQRQ
ncbi:unnamed protein product [Didymodactylos carnosus]|uniref:Uncharacterized protein n=1 Tax=Didymodactylos carnosus TaxID=1234261 RepID=A0A8S2PNL4_9BILA|nr:unnamed protein product [Didymodactylos carnosus]CAF4057974.1 unnamed protein product [Didymodactylos carnosus]